MPIKMINEMPLPIPFSVIFSPSHMMKIVPQVKVRTVSQMNQKWSICTACMPLKLIVVRNTAVAQACMAEMMTVR